MKTLILALTAAASLASCLAPGGGQALEQAVTAATDPASDGGALVTQEEAQAIGELAGGSVDWVQLIGTIGGSALLALLGVKIAPASALQGPFDGKGKPT